jgi:outer membrane protein assembly factor BamB
MLKGTIQPMSSHRITRPLLWGGIIATLATLLVGCSVTSTQVDTSPTVNTGTPAAGTPTASTTPSATNAPGATPTTGSGGTPLSSLSVYVGASDGYFYGVNAATGSKRWGYQLGDEAGKPAAANGIVYGATPSSGQVFAINNGNILWHVTPGGGVYSRPAVDINSGLVMVTSDNKNIYALHINDGSEAWHYTTGGTINGSLSFNNGLVFSGSGDGYVYAIHENNGSFAWKKNTGAPIEFASPTLAGSSLYIGNDSFTIYSLDQASGNINWHYQTGGQILAKPAVDSNAGLVFLGANDHYLYALHTSDGSFAWKHLLNDSVGTAIFDNGAVFVGSSDGTIFALNEGNGNQQWQKKVGSLTRSWFTATQGILYVGAADGLYALSEGSGGQQWKFTVSGGFDSPAVGA